MSNIFADRVKETTTTTGTGTLTLGGAVASFQAFSAAVGSGNSCDYCLLSGNGTDWETGNGTIGGTGPYTLARTTIYASSNANAAISLTGTSTVFLTLSAHSIGTGGSSVVSATMTADDAFASTPTTVTAITGLSVTVGPFAAAKTVLASYDLLSNPTQLVSFVMLDGARVTANYGFSGPYSDSDGNATSSVGNMPVSIPGDNATHTIAVGIVAQHSTGASTIKSTSWLSVLVP